MSGTTNISPMYVGDTSPNLQITVTDDTGAAINLTGATITMKLQLTTSTTATSGIGSWTIDNAALGKAHYVWNVADTANAGEYYLWINLAFSGSNQHLDPLDIIFLANPQ